MLLEKTITELSGVGFTADTLKSIEKCSILVEMLNKYVQNFTPNKDALKAFNSMDGGGGFYDSNNNTTFQWNQYCYFAYP